MVEVVVEDLNDEVGTSERVQDARLTAKALRCVRTLSSEELQCNSTLSARIGRHVDSAVSASAERANRCVTVTNEAWRFHGSPGKKAMNLTSTSTAQGTGGAERLRS